VLLMAQSTPSILTALESGASSKFFRRHLVFLHAYRAYLSVPTIVISPWVQKGAIEHDGINNGLTYTHSSIASFIAKASFFIC
jgi:Phosphoesterase family